MKKTKRLQLLSLLIVAVLAFSGCNREEKVTAENLLKEATEKMESIGSLSGNVNVDMAFSYNGGGFSGSIGLKANLDTEATAEPHASHMKGSVSFLGMDLDMESYEVEENGKTTTYTYAMNEWTKQEGTSSSFISQMNGGLVNLNLEDLGLTLADDTEKFEDKDVYVLTGELKGDSLSKMMQSSGDTLDSIIGDLEDEFDYSKLSADMKVLIYKDSRYLAQISMDMNDLKELAVADDEVSLEKCSITVSYYSFDDVDEIQVPEKAKSASSSGSGDGLNLFDSTGGSDNQEESNNPIIDPSTPTETKAPETTAAPEEVAIKDFSLDIPEGMQELEPDEGFAFMCIAEDGSNINMNIQDKDPTFSLVTGDLLNETLTSMMNQAYGVDLTIEDKYFKTDEIAGYPAYQYRFSYEIEGQVLEHLTVGIDADKTYTFTYTDFSGSSAWMNAFEASAKSIQLIPE